MSENRDGELGYHVTNPDAPAEEPKRFQANDPEHQADAVKIFTELADQWRSEGK